MPSLAPKHRKDLENAVKRARRVAEAGAVKALEQLAVGHHEPWGSMKEPAQRRLRNRLRAHGQQLGDARDPQRGTQAITRLKGEVAYEHWHRMLFARYLAENDLLIEPESGQAMTMDECRELAREQGQDWLPLACGFAQRMLPEIFRQDDPVLEVTLPPETRSELEDVLNALPRDVFLASDSLGWVYQFWQADQKDIVNKSEKKIGADELPAVTQLFTEDYMVDFLLDNTLGAWWAGRCAAISDSRFQFAHCPTEADARAAVALPGCPWNYLRFVKGEDGKWTPAAGTFSGWPKTAAALRALDPCMGSGHFVVAMFERLVAMRMAEERLDEKSAVAAVIRDNLFGLELDPRCTQIAAFNLALAAWRRVGHCALPPMHLACSGLAPNSRESDWLKLAGDSDKLQRGMARLYRLFQNGPVLGSLINPRAGGEGNLIEAGFQELHPLLAKALAQESSDDAALEMAVTAQGIAKAAEILAGQFTLVATNVPYLARGEQHEVLSDYCERVHPQAKADLATCFIERCIEVNGAKHTSALVTPQNWLSQDRYSDLRVNLLEKRSWHMAAQLGPGAFRSISGEVVKPLLFICGQAKANLGHNFYGIDVTPLDGAENKDKALRELSFSAVSQRGQLSNPKTRVSFNLGCPDKRIADFASYSNGIQTGDLPRFSLFTWELPHIGGGWACKQTTVDSTVDYGGMHHAVLWQDGDGVLAAFVREKLESENTGAWLRGKDAWGKRGVLVSAMGSLQLSLYLGDLFDDNSVAIIPRNETHLPAIWALCSDESYHDEVRKIDKALKVRGPLVEVPFDLDHWQKVAEEKFPDGLPTPFSSDPTQWLFNGHPAGSDQPLQVATARLVGYQWPRQTGSSFPDCPALGPDGLEPLADKDGIVCLSATKGEAPAADRLNGLLAAAFGSDWSAAKARELIAATGSTAKSLADWLSDDFFAQHCDLFHQRPFVWHIWDGQRGGFSALVNYHRLAAPDGAGQRTLEKLIYTYLGDWIDAQRKAQKDGIEGADARLTAAEHLRAQLELILKGEKPFDLFVRWKPLHAQPIGWNPDINDGVRLNIRPFMTAKPLNARGKNACILRITPKGIKWDKDRGKEPERPKADYPWFWSWDRTTDDFKGGTAPDGNRWNDCHYTLATKQAARERHGVV
jgi:hypothetical protein